MFITPRFKFSLNHSTVLGTQKTTTLAKTHPCPLSAALWECAVVHHRPEANKEPEHGLELTNAVFVFKRDPCGWGVKVCPANV